MESRLVKDATPPSLDVELLEIVLLVERPEILMAEEEILLSPSLALPKQKAPDEPPFVPFDEKRDELVGKEEPVWLMICPLRLESLMEFLKPSQ